MNIEERPGTENEHRKAVLLVGMGNIGSALAGVVARMPIGRVTLVDPDTYCEKNLGSQVMFPGDVGKPKAKIQAQRMRQIHPALEVRAVHARVEDLPLGMLRADVIAAGLDSRTSRCYVNQAAWRLGVPWVDGGVDAPGLLARVNVYIPGQNAPCAECAWDDGDYAALEQAYPCQPDGNGVAATNAPASLGAVTAGVMAVECQKLLDGDMEHLLHGRQVMLDLRHHTHYLTSFRRNPHCQFDHETWHIEPIACPPGEITIVEAMQLAAGTSRDLSGCALRVEGQYFVPMLFCPGCGNHSRTAPRVASRIPSSQRRCADCGEAMTTRGFDMREWLEGRTLTERDYRRPLSSLGIRPFDILTVRGPAGQQHFEIGGCERGAAAIRCNSPTAGALSDSEEPGNE